jgi:hypothetical protein
MKPIDDYAEQANRAVGRYYGHRLMFGHDLRPYIRCQDWFKEHWRRFPWTSPDGGRIIDNEPGHLSGFDLVKGHVVSGEKCKPSAAPLRPRIIEP